MMALKKKQLQTCSRNLTSTSYWVGLPSQTKSHRGIGRSSGFTSTSGPHPVAKERNMA